MFKSLNTIHSELEYLHQTGAVLTPQFQSIVSQLPVSILNLSHCVLALTSAWLSQQLDGTPSQYVDSRFGAGRYSRLKATVFPHGGRNSDQSPKAKHRRVCTFRGCMESTNLTKKCSTVLGLGEWVRSLGTQPSSVVERHLVRTWSTLSFDEGLRCIRCGVYVWFERGLGHLFFGNQ